MVAWRLRMRTPEYPKGRDAILIANDITFDVGSFAVEEDLVFLKGPPSSSAPFSSRPYSPPTSFRGCPP